MKLIFTFVTVLLMLPVSATATVARAAEGTDAVEAVSDVIARVGDQTITFSEIRDLGGRTLPSVMEVVPSDREGQSTTVTWTAAEFDQGVDPSVFTLRNLQSGSY